jgi:hypothetical protein
VVGPALTERRVNIEGFFTVDMTPDEFARYYYGMMFPSPEVSEGEEPADRDGLVEDSPTRPPRG